MAAFGVRREKAAANVATRDLARRMAIETQITDNENTRKRQRTTTFGISSGLQPKRVPMRTHRLNPPDQQIVVPGTTEQAFGTGTVLDFQGRIRPEAPVSEDLALTLRTSEMYGNTGMER